MTSNTDTEIDIQDPETDLASVHASDHLHREYDDPNELDEIDAPDSHELRDRRYSVGSFFKSLLTLLVLGLALWFIWQVVRNTDATSAFSHNVEQRLASSWSDLRSSSDLDQNELVASQESTVETQSPDAPLPPSGKVTAVEAMIVSSSHNQVSRTFAGMLKATQTSDLGFKRTGTIQKALVDQGDVVKKGDLLIELDVKQLKANIAVLVAQRNVEKAKLAELVAGPRKQTIEAARASLKELEALRDQARTTANRQLRLARDDAAVQQDVDDSRKQLEAAQNRVVSQSQTVAELEAGTRPEKIAAQRALLDQLNANVESVNVGIAESRLTAPFDGIVSVRSVDNGAIVLPGKTVIRLVESKTPEAWIGLPTSLVSDLSSGASYVLKTENQIMTGKLKSVLPELDPMTRTQTAIFTLTASDESSEADTNVPPTAYGQIVRLELPMPSSKGVWIPRTALTQSIEGTWAVFRIDSVQGTSEEPAHWIANRHDVDVGRIDSKLVLVLGLKSGESIVARGVHRLTPGQRVRRWDLPIDHANQAIAH